MMTNSKAIEQLKMQMRNAEDCLIEDDVLEYLLSALEENTKLKAEIEQLKRLSDQQSELNIEQFKQIDSQYQEIEQLKSELDQSVKLPCRVGDDIYFRVKGRNQFAEYVDFIQTQKITRIDIDEDGILYCSATEKFIETDIGKTIFLSREEAEQHLKGKVENENVR